MKVLIVVDMQNDFISGSLGTPQAQAIVPKVAEKVKQYIAEDGVVIYTRDTHFEDYLETLEGQKLPVPHCIVNTEGWQIKDEVYHSDSEVFDKYTFGYYGLPNEILGVCGRKFGRVDVESIEFVGVCTDICVVSNALIVKSIYRDIPIMVDGSCCAGTTPANHEAALKVMKSCQIEVK